MKGFGNILIIGDSYSTFKEFNPEGYTYWYPQGGTGHANTDVKNVCETWWHQLVCETKSNIILNDSYSGSTVCSTERESMPGTHFNLRVDKMIADGFFEKNKIDTIFIFGGTNDSCIDSPIGEIKYDGITEDDMKAFLPAFAALIAKLNAASPTSKIIPLINCDIKSAIADGMEEICLHYELTYIKFKIIDKLSGHPSRQGMTQIKDAIKNLL